MDEATLSRRLEALTPPDLDAARGRARAAARLRLGAGGSARVARRPPLRVALAVGLIAVAAAALTPAGQAAVSWVGEQIGIGDPGGPPTLETLRRGWTKGMPGEGETAYVLAAGSGPHGGHYELVTFEERSEEARCFELDMTKERSSYGLSCERLPGAHGLPLDSPLPAHGGLEATYGGNADPDLGFRYVGGRVSADIESVRVEFDGEPVPVELTAIPPELLEELGIERPFKFFIGFQDDWRSGGTFEVTGFDAGGSTVAHESLEAMPPMMPR